MGRPRVSLDTTEAYAELRRLEIRRLARDEPALFVPKRRGPVAGK